MRKSEILKHHFFLKKQVFHPNLLDIPDNKLLNFLLTEYGDASWDLYNFIIIVKHFYQSFNGPYTKVGALIYDKLESDLIKTYTDLRIFQLCIENELNEEFNLIYELKNNNFVFKVNLDKIMNRDVISILKLNTKNILIRTKDEELKIKIINMNLIYGVFIRLKNLIFLNKRSGIIEENNASINPEYSEWSEKIKFTKGYVIIFPDSYIKILLQLVHRRKIVTLKPIYINYNHEINTVRESLKNNNYSHPIWMKNLNINDFKKLEKCEIVNNILDDEFDANLLLSNLNFLNSIKISPNNEFFSIIEKISEKTNMLDKEYITKNKLEETLIESNDGVVYINKNKEISQEKLNCLNFVNLVKTQYERFKIFHMEYKRDGRVRIYNYNIPLNFQLSHLVRNTINIETSHLSDKKIINNFLKLEIWDKLEKKPIEICLFFWQKVNKSLIVSICEKFKLNYTYEGEFAQQIETNLKLEAILIMLESFTPKKIIPVEERIMWVLNNHLDNLLKLNLSNVNEIEKTLEILEIRKKKMHTIKNIYTLQKAYTENKYNEIFWVDASSNGIQLITLRLGKFNDLLLQLTNIIDNKTECRNIYSYVTNEMQKIDHTEFICIQLKNKINIKELNTLYNDDDNKDRIMPASYGKGKKRARKDMKDYITEETSSIWKKLSNKEQEYVSDYLWELVFTILNNIGFDLSLYKETCKNFLGEEEKLVCWYNDCDLPIIPFKEKKSNREILLKKIESLKFKKKNIDEKIQIKIDKLNKELQTKIDKITETIAWDERTYFKRHKMTTGKFVITPRIKHTNLEIDRIKTLTSLAPNATHSYDASNMDKAIALLALIGLKALPIFDSLGGELRHISLIKIGFKLANIENIENNYEKARFPHIEIKMSKSERINLYIKILESSYFIR